MTFIPNVGEPGKSVAVLAAPPSKLSAGNKVRVPRDMEVEVFKMMQQGHGGWNAQMVEVRLEDSLFVFCYTW